MQSIAIIDPFNPRGLSSMLKTLRSYWHAHGNVHDARRRENSSTGRRQRNKVAAAIHWVPSASIFWAVLFIAFTGCAGKKPAEQRVAPSTGQVRADFDRSDVSAASAAAASERVAAASHRLGSGIAKSRSLADRIDHKASVLLELR